nr:antibiotic biosynthesis monooxygenase [Actinocatenispora thailandica]
MDERDVTGPDPDAERDFLDRAERALAALAGCAGFVHGELGRAADDPTRWCLATRWASIGAYRRALGSYQVKVAATPLLAEAVDEPTGYEVLRSAGADGITAEDSDRAPGEANRPPRR